MDGSSTRGDVTRLLQRWSAGDRAALDDLVPIVYAELRRIAEGYFSRERSSHTLQPTALIHEAWMRMARQQKPVFDHRRQFYALAAQMMRRILVDHARATGAEKRGGDRARTTLDTALGVAVGGGAPPLVDLLALDQALTKLAAVSPRQARVIELRYFAGLGVEDLAEILEVSPATISRDQRVAEAWLGQAMAGGV